MKLNMKDQDLMVFRSVNSSFTYCWMPQLWLDRVPQIEKETALGSTSAISTPDHNVKDR